MSQSVTKDMTTEVQKCFLSCIMHVTFEYSLSCFLGLFFLLLLSFSCVMHVTSFEYSLSCFLGLFFSSSAFFFIVHIFLLCQSFIDAF